MRVTLIAIAVIAAALLAACGDDDGSGDTVEQHTATEGAPLEPEVEQPLSPAEEHGRMLFVERCGSCHTLDAAGTTGQIGPNLGDIPLDEADVRRAIEIGGQGSGLSRKKTAIIRSGSTLVGLAIRVQLRVPVVSR
jgi:mono/diheme cytochrome c family protein